MSNVVKKHKVGLSISLVLLIILAILFLTPIGLVLMNSFKGEFFISDAPFDLPDEQTFVGLDNYVDGIAKTGFFDAFGWSMFITVISVIVIVLFTSMTGWYITRIKTWWTKLIYFALVFSMVVPFQMVMFPMSLVSDMLSINNPFGIVFIYLGFGAGLSTFMFAGFVKSIPLEVEEAAVIDGCGPIRTYFRVVFPIIKPTAITVAILNTMWVWNDYLLPLLVLDSDYYTVPIVIQQLRGSYGAVDMGAMMAMLVLAILPIIVFYLTSQKYIIKGVASGAVKG